MEPVSPSRDQPKARGVPWGILVLAFIPLASLVGVVLAVRYLGAPRPGVREKGPWARAMALAGLLIGGLNTLFVLVYVGSFMVDLFVPVPKSRFMESDVKYMAHTLQLSLEDYKVAPGHEGHKPTTRPELRAVIDSIPEDQRSRKNPFDPSETYGGGGIVFGLDSIAPGRVCYVCSTQAKPYAILAYGKDRTVILRLEEPPPVVPKDTSK